MKKSFHLPYSIGFAHHWHCHGLAAGIGERQSQQSYYTAIDIFTTKVTYADLGNASVGLTLLVEEHKGVLK